MTATLLTFCVSAGSLGLLTLLYWYEDKRGERVFLSGIRVFFDRVCSGVWKVLSETVVYVWRAITHFFLHYVIYRFIGTIVSYLRGLESRVEERIVRHRTIATREDRPRNHLDEIADHKHSLRE